MSKASKQTTYRVDGLTCTNCAGKFEKNVKNLEGVTDAKVNFGAGKISVYGETSISQIEKAGAFENLRITNEKDYSNTPAMKESFLKKNWHLVVSIIFILLAFVSQNISGEDSTTTIILYVIAIVVGGFNLGHL